MLIRESNVEEEAPISLMPLIDMVFLLLIFFLIATTFAQEERDLSVQLPGTMQEAPLSAPPQELIINIRANGEMVIGPKVFKDEGPLRDLLVRVARNEPNRKVLIRCDLSAPHRHFAAVARICRESGINPLNIGYIVKQPEPIRVQ